METQTVEPRPTQIEPDPKPEVRFLSEDINIAINMTLADLDGYNHPVGFKFKKYEDQKGFSFIPLVLIAFAAGKHSDETRARSYQYDSRSEEEVRKACQIFRQSCSESQRQAVVSLIKLIRKEDLERKAMRNLRMSQYKKPLSKKNWFGLNLLLLAKAFEVKLARSRKRIR